MPFFATPLPETYLSVTRRVARSAIGSLFTLTTLPKEKTVVSFSGESGQSLIWNSRMKEYFKPNENFNQKLGNYGKFSVEIKEETVEDHNLIMETVQDIRVPLFQAKTNADIMVKPVYDKTKLTLSCTWRAENREEADIFRNDLRHHIADGRAEVPIEVQYYILLPDPTIALLYHLHELQEKQAGYGIDFQSWLHQGSFGNVKQITKLNGQGTSFVIEERQIMVYGTFEFTTPPERSKKDQGSAHEVTFDFTITYDKPIEVVNQYPLMVHNQLVHEMFHPKPQYDISRIPAHRDVFRYVSDQLHWANKAKAFPNAASPIVLPEYDAWEPTMERFEILLGQCMIELDKEDLKAILNIFDFEEVGACIYSQQLKRYFRFYREFLTNSRESPFFFALYEGDKRVESELYEVYPNGDIRSLKALDLRKEYHIVIGFNVDWRQLTDGAIRRLANVPTILDEFLEVIHPDYNKINWEEYNKKMKALGIQPTGDKALDFLRSQGHIFDKWNDPRWAMVGTKPIARNNNGWIKQWAKEFYLEHGRYPSEEEIDNFYRQLPPDMQHNFFGHADEDELRKRYLYRFQGSKAELDSYAWRLYRHVGFFTVIANERGKY